MRISDWSSDVCASDLWTPMDDSAPLFEVEDTPFGYHYAATRKLPPGREDDRFRNVRITPAIFPTGRIIRGPIMDFLVWETPDDDYSTSTFITVYANQPIEESWIRSAEHTSELQSLMRISYAVFCLNNKTTKSNNLPSPPTQT